MHMPGLPDGPDGPERVSDTEKYGSAFLTFCFYGAVIGFTVFFGLAFGFKLSEGWATLSAWIAGPIGGYYISRISWMPKAGSALWGQYWNKPDK